MSSLYKSCRNILQCFYPPEVWQEQKIQTYHRLKLIRFWRIPPGARVLEIGCGQGDTLAALCFAVGENGFVHGVDLASSGYGSPETLGQAKDRLLRRCKTQNLTIDLDLISYRPKQILKMTILTIFCFLIAFGTSPLTKLSAKS